ncbi:hypothetical protein HYW20_00845 [Candidatus Woesearchaeota archaeon]|nr:hypothetical protein [Candidatus Woesearchaeota archaeon]
MYTKQVGIKNGFLGIPLEAKSLYSPNGNYILKREELGGNSITILPEHGIRDFLYDEFEDEFKVNEFLSKSVNLEARVENNGVHSIRLPEDYLSHLRLEKNSVAVILMFDYLRLWNPGEFRRSRENAEMRVLDIGTELGL